MNWASSGRLRIVVLGYIVRGPMGGMAWHHLQYVMGLRDLGHDVHFLEDSDDTPWCCFDPVSNVTSADPSYGIEFARRLFDRAGLGERWAYYCAHRTRWLGPCAERITNICANADLVLNVSCANPLRPWLAEVPVRVLIDTDPVFTQVRNLTDPARMERALRHNTFFSFAENIASGRSQVPDDGFPWQATRQPIVLSAWPVTPGPTDGKFTTVMQWDSYPVREYAGVSYGMKSKSFEPYLDLPQRTSAALELAVGGEAAPRALLRARNWSVRDPFEVTSDPWAYQQYVQSSKAEFTVAKQGYVVSRSGWFSERSAAYLASGRPVVTQETGFSDWMECGSGVISFASADEALAAIDGVDAHYTTHCQTARDMAVAYFDSRKVLSELIERAMDTKPVSCPSEQDH
jgi:hypothetical protein